MSKDQDVMESFDVGRCHVEIIIDQNCPDPMKDYDSEGKFYSFNSRHVNSVNQEEAERIMKEEKYWIPLSYFEHGNCLWDVQGGPRIGSCPDMQWDGCRFAGLWVPCKYALDNIHCTVYHELLPNVSVEYKSKHNPDGTCITRPPKPGEKPYFQDGTCIDRRYSNVITWTVWKGKKKRTIVKEKGGYKNFTTAYQAAARFLGIKFTKEIFEAAMKKAVYEYAKSCCETYSSWCNGECYGYVVTADNGEEDSCFGFLGDMQYCIDEAKAVAERMNKDLVNYLGLKSGV